MAEIELEKPRDRRLLKVRELCDKIRPVPENFSSVADAFDAMHNVQQMIAQGERIRLKSYSTHAPLSLYDELLKRSQNAFSDIFQTVSFQKHFERHDKYRIEPKKIEAVRGLKEGFRKKFALDRFRTYE